MKITYIPSELKCEKEYSGFPEFASTCRFCDSCMNPVFDFRRSTIEEFEVTKREYGDEICGHFLTDNKGDILFIKRKKMSVRTKFFLLAFLLCFSDALIAGDNNALIQCETLRNEIMLLTDSGKTDVVFTLYDAGKRLRNKEVLIIHNGDTIHEITNKKGELRMSLVSSDTVGQILFVYNDFALADIESDELVGIYFKKNRAVVGRYTWFGRIYQPGKYLGRTRARF